MAQLNDSSELLDHLIFINNLINKICGMRESNHIMESIIGELVNYTNSDQGVISLFSLSGADDLSTVVRVIDKREEQIPYPISVQLAGWILKNKTVLKIDDLDTDSRFSGISSMDGKYKYLIGCPLIARGEYLGITTLVRSAGKAPFSESDSRLIGILAPQASHLLSNARLIEELAKTNELLEISRRKLKEEYYRLQDQIGSIHSPEIIVGKSKAINSVKIQVSKISATDTPVLITGETGTGKDLVARAIHYNSDRRDKPFVILNCGLKTETLLESELFGYLKGAFTGAIRNKPGLFKEADKGTIFLDEIGNAPLSTQAAILRVLQNGEIRPIGSGKTDHVDVRIISATNKDLADQMKRGEFRDDLYFRLATFIIELPPLRDRRDDVPLLVNYFIEKTKIKLKNDRLSISPDAMDALVNYNWPGNIRELESEIERAAITCGAGGVIYPNDLSRHLSEKSIFDSNLLESGTELRHSVEKVEKAAIRRALAENQGNYTKTAQSLGITRKGLMNKISRYKIAVDYNKLIGD